MAWGEVGSLLEWGSRGLEFESRHSDQKVRKTADSWLNQPFSLLKNTPLFSKSLPKNYAIAHLLLMPFSYKKHGRSTGTSVLFVCQIFSFCFSVSAVTSPAASTIFALAFSSLMSHWGTLAPIFTAFSRIDPNSVIMYHASTRGMIIPGH